jgi:cathepsin L
MGAVSGIKDQGNCGSCYAFASAAALESLYKIKYGTLYSFSPQQIVDCSGSFYNYGCNGGNMGNSYSYLQTSKIQ